MLGAERRPPYDRPPLSKQFLAGAWEADRVALRVDEAVVADLRLGVRATGLDLVTREITVDGGDRHATERLPFDALLVATGARPRVLPGTDGLDGVFTLRTFDDCVALREALAGRPRVAVIGAGFIGSEVAATCRGLGLDVTVIEALDLPLVRVLGTAMGEVCAAVHRDHGTGLRLGVGVQAVEGADRAERVRLADGSAVEADVVVVGIGVAPVTDWLDGSELAVADGVVCDRHCRAAPGVYAAGDVARWENPLFGEAMRIEHWTNAVEMGTYAAGRMLQDADGGGSEDGGFAPVPYFWSDQYDRKIQFVGHVSGAGAPVVVEGSVEDRRFVAAYGRDGRLVAALSMNMPHRIMAYRAMIAAGTPFPPPGP